MQVIEINRGWTQIFFYKSVNVGKYIPDLIASIGNNEKAQVINYLKITKLRVGLILNFKHAKLEYQRIIL
ncbi:MAG: GxxExxY protein [Chthoniobacterales bacterium]